MLEGNIEGTETMRTTPRTGAIANPLRNIGTVLRITGWLSLWLQLGLGAVSGLVLLFVFSGRNFTNEATPGIGFSIFWAGCGLVALMFNIYLAFRFTRLARRFRAVDLSHHPKKADTIQIVRWSVIVGIVGLLLNLFGAGAAIGVLISKAIALPQGIAVYEPSRIIRPLDVFVAAANINGLTAHFVGMVAALWLFSWLHRQ